MRYYQSFNVWCSYHMSGFFKWLFRSHYFDTLLDELAKVYPSGYGRAVRDAYKSIYTSRLECVRSTDIHYWYGQHESLAFLKASTFGQRLKGSGGDLKVRGKFTGIYVEKEGCTDVS